MRRTTFRLAAAAAAVLLPTSALTVTSASPALASCSAPSVKNGGGGWTVDDPTTLWVYPTSTCAKVGTVGTDQVLWAWCDILNPYGNTWWYVRVGGTSTYGWIYPTNGTVSFFNTYTSDGRGESTVACDS